MQNPVSSPVSISLGESTCQDSTAGASATTILAGGSNVDIMFW